MRLVREWHGTTHVVTIDEKGRMVWNGREWSSLSAIAKAITRTAMVGPGLLRAS